MGGAGSAPLRGPWFDPIPSTRPIRQGDLQAPVTAGGTVQTPSFREDTHAAAGDGQAGNAERSGAGPQTWASDSAC